MRPKIKPVPTKYKRHKFRSRLEARWAVFFDALKIKWEYESDGYELDNEWYLPDFYLPFFNGGVWVEVKCLGGDFRKTYEFCKKYKVVVWLCEGAPEARAYKVITGNDTGEIEENLATPLWDQGWNDNRFFWEPGYEEKDGTYADEYCDANPEYMNAVEKANGYDF